MVSLVKRLKRIVAMAKNERKKGRSARNGNKPSPYTKYNKQPYKYTDSYKDNVLINGILCRNGHAVRHNDDSKLRNMRFEEAAE